MSKDKTAEYVPEGGRIEALKRVLHGNHIAVHDSTSLFKSLEWLPEENKKELLRVDYSDVKSVADAYQKWGREGILRFTPYLNPFATRATLTVKHNVHVHIFRRMYFQSSDTPFGVGSNEIGCERIDKILSMSFEDCITKSLYVNMLMYAAFIDVGFHYANVVDWFMSNTDAADDFIHKAFMDEGFELVYNWKDIARHIQELPNTRIAAERKLFRIAKGRDVLCEFAVGEKSIEVMVAGDSDTPIVYRLTLPEDIVNAEYTDVDDVELYAEDIAYTTVGKTVYRRDLVMLLVMLMKLAGIHINWMVAYKLKPLGRLQGSNRPGVIAVDSLEDVYLHEPDEF